MTSLPKDQEQLGTKYNWKDFEGFVKGRPDTFAQFVKYLFKVHPITFKSISRNVRQVFKRLLT